MKTYKTWEMLKELTENPNKEFERVSDGFYIKAHEHEEVFWSNGYGDNKLTDTWVEIVKKPVDFITAVESGKAISVRYSGYRYQKANLDELLYLLTLDHDSSLVRSFILYGTWYIED